MKNVVIYVRVSTDEQANKGYSLRDQEQKLIAYCNNNNYNIVEVYKDDHSAKSFNRPAFKKLLIGCKKKRLKIDQMLFVKWDRFSRNTAQAYQMIGQLNSLGIKLNAIEQPLDLDIPEQLLMLAVYLAIPEVENHRRSLNITAGMRRAFKEGRYVVSPPKGYTMCRDSNNKPLIKPDEDAKYIVKAFELLAKGVYSQKQVLERLKSKGFKTSKSAFARIIRNPIYIGDIHIKEFKDEKASIVKGLHQPIISRDIFNKVQTILDGGKKQHKVVHKKVNDKFPLKGFVLCPNCYKPLRASKSKGRNQYYSYYHCKKPCNTRYKLEEVNTWFDNFLSGISLNPPAQKIITKMVEELFEQKLKSTKLGPKHFQKINDLEDKLLRIEDLFIQGDFDSQSYHSAKNRYTSMLDDLKSYEKQIKDKSVILKTYKQGIKQLQNFDNYYRDSDINQKRELLGSIFPEKFQFEKTQVRTEDINPLLLKISTINNELKGNKKRDKSKNHDSSLNVLKAGLEPARTLQSIGF